MERVEPGPAGHSFVVVVADPLQSLDVGGADEVLELQKLLGLDSELLSVILFLVVVDGVAENRVVFQVVFGSSQLLDLFLEGLQRLTPIDQQFLLLPAGPDILLIELSHLRLLLLPDNFLHHVLLVLLHLVDEKPEVVEIQFSRICEVAIDHPQGVLVHSQQDVDAALPDSQDGNVRQEIIAHEETQEHEVVYHALQLVLCWFFGPHEVQVQELPHQLQV